MSKTFVDFLECFNIIEIFGQEAATCLPHSQALLAKKTLTLNRDISKIFYVIKATIAKDVSSAYPDHSKGFEIYTDGSKRQLGAVIAQNNCFLFQQKTFCFITKIEVLAIVETFKEFKGMPWGQKIVVYTHHENVMQDSLGLTCDSVYCWRLLLEEYGHKIIFI
ncbi:hypothetical protein ACHAW6_004716 [Cyclotella cf. meneghiniana]